MTKQQTLEQQIVAALTDDALSACDLAELVGTTEAAIKEADNAAEQAKTAFYDPVMSPDVHLARDLMETTEATAARLRSLLPRLLTRYRELAAAEDRAKWTVRSDVLERERDQLAAELREVYPAKVSQLADLFNRIAINDAALSELHGTRPPGSKGTLLGAELVARNLDEFTRDQPPLARNLALPDWADSAQLLWPPRELPAAVMIAEAVATGDPRRYSGAWHEVLREDNERRVTEEAKRIEQERQAAAADKAAYERALPR